MVVDIGGGTTEVGVISLGGMVYSGSVRVGGDKFDEAIINYIRRNYGMLIGETTAEQIKKNIGSAFPGSEVREMEVKGRNLAEGHPAQLHHLLNEILEALTDPLNQIVSRGEERARADPARARRRHRREGHGAHRRRRAAARPRPPADGGDGAAGDRRRRPAHLRGARLGQGAREDGAFFASLSLTLLVLDARFGYAESIRTVLALAAYPIQQAARLPVLLAEGVAGYFGAQARLREENECAARAPAGILARCATL
jgi:hypothetical protein